MNILLVHNYYKKKLIGGEDIVFERELDSLRRHEGNNNIYEYHVSNDGMSIWQVLANVFYSKKSNRNIAQIIKKYDIQIMHVHNFFPLISTSIFLTAKKLGVKTIHTLHNYRFWCIGERLYREDYGICEKCVNMKLSIYGIFHGCFRNSRIQSLVFGLAFFFYRINKSFNAIDYFITLTKFQYDKILSFGISESKLKLKPNFNSMPNVNRIQNENKSGYLFIGRLEESKGISQLLNIWRNLPEEFQLKIIGDGPLLDKLKALNIPNVEFYGTLQNDDVKIKLASSRYLLQTSLCYETFGLTIIEAFQMGTPVIGLNIGPRKDFIINNCNGFIADNFDDLEPVIRKSYNYIEYNSLTQNALITAEKYNENDVINQQIEVYKEIAM